MSGGLPDITRMDALPADTWRELSGRFRAAGFDARYLASISGDAGRAYDTGVQLPILLWRARRRRETAAYAYRMFILRDPVGDAEAVELLGYDLLRTLLDAGMLARRDHAMVASVFDLRVFRGFWVLCDDLLHRGDAVFGVGAGTHAFCGVPSAGRMVRRAADVACGAGAVALWLSTQVELVIATDINPRALAFVRINAALNECANIQTRRGDLLDPVFGETFDFIAAQPPCVPAAPGAAAATYLYGGPAGREMVDHLLADLPCHLNRTARAIVVFEQARPDTPVAGHGVGAEAGDNLRTLYLVGAEVDADAYSMRHALLALRHGIEAFDHTAMVMREHLEAVGVRGISPAVCVMDRDADSTGWTDTIQTSDTLWSEVSTETIERVLSGLSRLHQPPGALPRGHIRIPDGSLVIRHWGNGCCGDGVYLGLPHGYLVSPVELNDQEWAELEALHLREPMASPSRALFTKAARAGLMA